MAISLFDMLKVGIGPSSSHTVGPMKAAQRFVVSLEDERLLDSVARVQIQLYGSLGATGRGHGTGSAVLLGLEGHRPEEVDPAQIPSRSLEIISTSKMELNGKRTAAFDEDQDLIFHQTESLPYHANGMSFTAFDNSGKTVSHKVYYSVGGGFVVDEEIAGRNHIVEDETKLPYLFTSGDQLLEMCRDSGLTIAEIMMENEKVWRSEEDIRAGILHIWQVMRECVQTGIQREGCLPGPMKVKRRSADLYKELSNQKSKDLKTPSLGAMDWINLYALAVNEENAAGGRIVTAPTNGAAGIIPSVLHYYMEFCPGSNEEGVIRFLLSATAIGILFKINASISGAEVGCQGEVGSACAMAAAGLAEVLGGTPAQVENAAEIGMEHNLGLTCDPIGGLVQIPCIERNAMAAVKAINAASLALRGDGEHLVSLDEVIKTMRDTGRDMLDIYKETSRGGLAVNVIEC
ncbi:MAG: L-serine ammonia-lyase [Alphaproteobacteria bacterium]|jgi:L-serine dehydratase|nr:L-serine ammonia-lyase [Alphaproteobacteria bacterium]MBT4083491.1 L-serine ammonia-lyase [Alphaproteobacteria bacterium]MBT4544936.1 L-serine ammonia-lyase [Alphaproteobacteria bacterium]MBT7743705.1 L-serine ammonia-lyase [Alphaproteobacteria bacterium]